MTAIIIMIIIIINLAEDEVFYRLWEFGLAFNTALALQDQTSLEEQ